MSNKRHSNRVIDIFVQAHNMSISHLKKEIKKLNQEIILEKNGYGIDLIPYTSNLPHLTTQLSTLERQLIIIKELKNELINYKSR